jgi:DNA-binding transcriptional ArsR family regulator
MADNVVFLEPGDERAQKIAKAMGSQTASDILHILGEGPRSLTDITERLNIPMNTAKYHVENLLDAGLIAVEKTKYSIKGREVKIYMLTNQLLVVAPRQSDARSLFLKYASLFGIVILGSLLIAAFTPLFGADSMLRGSANTLNMAPPQGYEIRGGDGLAREPAGIMAQNLSQAPEVMKATTQGLADISANTSPAMISTPSPATIPGPEVLPVGAMDTGAMLPGLDPALAFFLGGALVIFVLICYEIRVWKKHYK